MSTRTHWLRPIDKRITACGRNSLRADVFAGSAAEYLGISNFCVKCELAAQREHGSGKPKSLPAPLWPEPRPIAEAPKDGSELLVWFPKLGWIKGGWSRLFGWNASGYIPTHFLPLPPAPEVRK